MIYIITTDIKITKTQPIEITVRGDTYPYKEAFKLYSYRYYKKAWRKEIPADFDYLKEEFRFIKKISDDIYINGVDIYKIFAKLPENAESIVYNRNRKVYEVLLLLNNIYKNSKYYYTPKVKIARGAALFRQLYYGAR